MIAEVKDMAGDRAGELDFSMSYMGEGIHQPTKDVQRHRDAIGELEAVGRQLGQRRLRPMTPRDARRGSRPSARPTAPESGPRLHALPRGVEPSRT